MGNSNILGTLGEGPIAQGMANVAAALGDYFQKGTPGSGSGARLTVSLWPASGLPGRAWCGTAWQMLPLQNAELRRCSKLGWVLPLSWVVRQL